MTEYAAIEARIALLESRLDRLGQICTEVTEENKRLREELEAGISDMQAILNLADGGKLEISILKKIVEHRADANAAHAALSQQEDQPPVKGDSEQAGR